MGLLGPAPQQEQREPGALERMTGGFLTPDRVDRAIIAMQGMTMNPNEALMRNAQANISGRADTRKTQEQTNKTVALLEKLGADPKLIEMAKGGYGAQALQMATTQPKATGQVVTADQLRSMYPGVEIPDGTLYNISPDGKISPMGGGGQNIDIDVDTGAQPLRDADLQKKLSEREGTSWAAMLDQGAVAASTMNDMLILDELITMAPQGPITGRLAEAFPGFDSAASAFNSIVKRLAPTMRAEGSGSTSDIEYNGMLRSLPQLLNHPEANRAIAGVMKAKAQIDMERAQIIQAYQNSNGEREDAIAARRALGELNSRSILTPELSAILSELGPVPGGGSNGNVPEGATEIAPNVTIRRLD
jgi:hypothetical protein